MLGEDLKIGIAKFESKEYDAAVALRYEVLRKPLGMVYTPEQLAEEATETHVIAVADAKVVGVLLLKRISDKKLKMRQFAVDDAFQGQGIGSALVAFAEDFAIENGFSIITLNARMTAVPFYERLGYDVVGDEFVEVGIPHLRMVKEFD
jgi:hypothetical protein